MNEGDGTEQNPKVLEPHSKQFETATITLNSREAHTLLVGLSESVAVIRRKRSWRLSEKAAAVVDIKMLAEKIQNQFPGLI